MKAEQEKAAVAHAFKGDEVYFTRAGQPVVGKVAAFGKHGCTVEHGGKRHQVKWEHVLGHKKRAVQRYHVADEGEDGMIVRDGSGRHHFVAIPPESREEQLELAKALRLR